MQAADIALADLRQACVAVPGIGLGGEGPIGIVVLSVQQGICVRKFVVVLPAAIASIDKPAKTSARPAARK
jgi:hypothetical protein